MLKFYGREIGFGALIGILTVGLTVSFSLITFYLGIDVFVLLFPFLLGIQLLYFLLYSFWILWFGFSPSYQAIMQRFFKKKPHETSEQELTGKGIRYLISGLAILLLFDLSTKIVFNIV